MSEFRTEAVLTSKATFFTAADGRLRPSWRVFISIFLFLVAAYGAAIIASALQRHSDNGFNAIYRPLMAAMLVALYALMWRGIDLRERFFESVGLGLSRPWLKELATGTLVGGLLIVVCVAIIEVVGDYSAAPTQDPPNRIAFLMLVQFWILFWGAIAEEMAFRGYPFQRMIEAWGVIPAICVSSLLFGSVHLLNPHFAVLPMVNTMLIGALFAVIYIKTGSLWLPWGLHFGWNFALGVIFGLPVSGLYQFAVWNRGIAAGPDWLTGGAYGLEASITAAAVVSLGIIAAWLWWPEYPQKVSFEPEAARIQLNQSS